MNPNTRHRTNRSTASRGRRVFRDGPDTLLDATIRGMLMTRDGQPGEPLTELPKREYKDLTPRVGICLSGGGLRAASFALGVIQILQEKRTLLYGEKAARFLSAVSGGSYIAATHSVNARRMASEHVTEPPPLAPGSLEEQHVLANGRYLVRPLLPTIARVFVLGMLNLTSLLVLFVWSGTLLGDAAVLVGAIEPLSPFNRWLDTLPLVLVLIALIVAIYLFVHAFYSDKVLVQRGVVLLPALCTSFLAGSTYRSLTASSPTTSWAVLTGSAIAAMLVTAGLAGLLQKASIDGVLAAVVNWAQVVVVRLTGGVLLLWSGLAWYQLLAPTFDGSDEQADELTGLVLFLGSLGLGLVFSYVPDRASLHVFYRERIRSCFGFDRGHPSGVPAEDIALSESWVDGVNNSFRSPQLLICATANVSNRTAQGKRRAYAPFVMASGVCGVPGTEAAFTTTQLEFGRVRASLRGKAEPLVSLFSAVAMTGAAVSPSMGRRTVPSARPGIAALNIRLGRWLPNPFSSRMRTLVGEVQAPRSFDWDKKLGPGWDELVPEMLGLSGTHVYISDGAHYDNLGLLALIREQCSEIWCVDASSEPDGEARELQRVLRIGRDDLGVTPAIDLQGFRALPDGLYGTTFTTGTLSYPRHPDATVVSSLAPLHIIKLGLAAESPQDLKDYPMTDKGFPHHSTARQWYSQKRMEAYRDLGRDSATRALESLGLTTTVPSPRP